MARFDHGWTKNHRALENHWVGEDGIAYALFLRLISWANYEETKKFIKGELIIIKRGQVLTSVRELATSFKFDRSAVERRLQNFEKDMMIVREMRHPGTIITICNYDKYQCIEGERETANVHRTATRPANIPANQPTLIEEVKKERSKEGGEAHTLYRNLFLSVVKREPFNYSEDIQTLLENSSVEDALLIIRNFFASTNPYYVERCYDSKLLLTDMNKLRGAGQMGLLISSKKAKEVTDRWKKRQN